jgi:hypothetical protein
MTTTKRSDSIDAAGAGTPFRYLQTASKKCQCLSEKPLFLQIVITITRYLVIERPLFKRLFCKLEEISALFWPI